MGFGIRGVNLLCLVYAHMYTCVCFDNFTVTNSSLIYILGKDNNNNNWYLLLIYYVLICIYED